MIYITFLIIFILSILLVVVLQRAKIKKANFQSLQVNLDRARNKVVTHEQQLDVLHHELNTLRAEAGGLRAKVNELSRYEAVKQIEHYVEQRRLEAEALVEMSKANASAMLNTLNQEMDKVRQYLKSFQKTTHQQIEKKARERLQAYYQQAKQQQELLEISKALENKIAGYGNDYHYPIQHYLDEFISGYGDQDAIRYLNELRMKTQNAIEQDQAAVCNYIEDSRRLAAIGLIVQVFNSKVDLYLSQLNQHNLGQLSQALKDDFVLINHQGEALGNTRLNESFLQLRLNELKFAAIVLNAQQQVEQPSNKIA